MLLSCYDMFYLIYTLYFTCSCMKFNTADILEATVCTCSVLDCAFGVRVQEVQLLRKTVPFKLPGCSRARYCLCLSSKAGCAFGHLCSLLKHTCMKTYMYMLILSSWSMYLSWYPMLPSIYHLIYNFIPFRWKYDVYSSLILTVISNTIFPYISTRTSWCHFFLSTVVYLL